MTKTDSDLYAGVQSGDRRALEYLYQKYEKLLYSYAYKMTTSHELSEEIIQDVFVKVWQKKGAYDASKGKLSTWLITITRYSAIDILRKQKTPTFEYEEQDGAADTSEHFYSSVEKAVTAGEDQDVIRLAMQSLNKEQEKIITLFYFKAYSQSQISEALNLPLGTVKSRLRLALGHLRKNIEQERKGGTQNG